MAADRTEWVGRLADLHGRLVYNAAYRIVGNTDDAEDVLQTVFLRLLDGTAAEDHARDWGAFLRVSATRAAVDVTRRKRNIVTEDSITMDTRTVPDAVSPDEVLDGKRLAALTRQALEQIPARDAEVFALRHFEEMPYEDIVGHLGISTNQVGVILHRARKRLRQILEPLLNPERSRKDERNVQAQR
ncbi:MAG: sigma-70 family RNA polymerase sigma factor [Candidatus Sumerlaeaceae bacterium]|nr:sigma-70 family RNA polymerase sigma factor [Candidatus Sumerlaeaceae bacterium]